jgi:hypothetical protein
MNIFPSLGCVVSDDLHYRLKVKDEEHQNQLILLQVQEFSRVFKTMEWSVGTSLFTVVHQ